MHKSQSVECILDQPSSISVPRVVLRLPWNLNRFSINIVLIKTATTYLMWHDLYQSSSSGFAYIQKVFTGANRRDLL